MVVSMTRFITARASAWIVLVLTVLVAGGLFAFGSGASGTQTPESGLPDAGESAQAAAIADDLDDGESSTALLVYERAGGELDQTDLAAIQQTLPDLGEFGQAVPPQLAEDGSSALVVLVLDAEPDVDLQAERADGIREAAAVDGLTLYLSGPEGFAVDVAGIFAGADVTLLADALGHDARIGRRFLNAGVGFGGGCLPKDIRAFTARAEELGRGQSLAFLREVDEINLRRRQRMVDLVVESFGGRPFGRRVAVLGLAFKPESDDVRDSPALDVAVRLKGLGAEVVSHDPEAMGPASRMHPQLAYAASAEEALRGAEAVVLVTEWREYRDLDPAATAQLVDQAVIFDGRNVLDAAAWRAAGWTYRGLGRP